MTGGVQRLARLALLLALATVIHTAESLLPLTFVWFRFGFANIIGLSTLYLFGFQDALVVTLGRIFLGSLASGLFGSPAFLLSLSGGLFAILAMGFAHRFGNRLFSEVGVSLMGAVAHNAAQLVVAYIVLIRNEGVFLLFPLLLATALGTGILNGLAARFFISTFLRTLGEEAEERT
ncbi:MAG: Gx transporter family protein [Desulfomonile tiedjei]|uniref:Gx transporter family protein n=1 Tax=Desulfomonile tiedjei TaxID=2358 RepID=A0A9D6Z7L1_9BACT|nr:Gx transporter family protein [Desulfomonile tiedjei]